MKPTHMKVGQRWQFSRIVPRGGSYDGTKMLFVVERVKTVRDEWGEEFRIALLRNVYIHDLVAEHSERRPWCDWERVS